MYKAFGKRLIDVVLSGIGILVLLIPMLIIALIIKIDSPGKVFFTQERVGIHKKPFKILKFRSMRTDTPHDMPTHMLSNPDAYITKFGKWMRKMSVDELPQILCIFIGTMTIIGPRPALFNQEDLLRERDKYGANDVKPGLTGLAQIRGRDELPIDVKAALDGEYVQKMSFLFDAKLFFSTILSVLRSDGVVEGARAPEKEEVAK
ncbi:MAG: sugar transferase [Clostridia bacterium]|nr:sugar transferase [Clostridia bacterium]